ncbi:hypothetical protein J4E85_009794 [Alternaria conjuncta]|uniref:uncharacterized protein n=1 Tax=Alternaria conjuncta TaxID=181017 RepID=UPI002220700D|nr:uncharacterized protein J4E85_009794 [Alternaria conjuncta]KAI4917702.1 hypothetical protein J4E85_009794 [Alternaria conjuncta]
MEIFGVANVPPPPKGYPKLAILMGEDPDVAIFRRFGALNALVLMRLQAELIEIEKELRTKQGEDDMAGPPRGDYSTNLFELNLEHASTEGDDDHPNQMALLKLAQAKLERYHRLLLTTAEVTKLQQPSDRRFKFVRRWLRTNGRGKDFQEDDDLLRMWSDDAKHDMVALTREDHDDNVPSAWFVPKLVKAYDYFFKLLRPLFPTTKIQDPEDYDYTTLIAVVTWTLTLLSTVAISLLPSLIILWLFHVKRTITRIWITIVATICMGVLLRVLDTATIKEIFGGTAAYVLLNIDLAS